METSGIVGRTVENQVNMELTDKIDPKNYPLPPRLSIGKYLLFVPLLARDPFKGLVEIMKQHGSFIFIRDFWVGMILLSDPVLIKYILKTDYLSFPRRKTLENIKRLLGEGVFRANNELWDKMKTILRPAFHYNQIRNYEETVKKELDNTISEWRGKTKHGELIIDSEFEIRRMMLKISTRSLIAPDINVDAEPLIAALQIIFKDSDHINYYFLRHVRKIINKIPNFEHTPHQKKVDDAYLYIEQLAEYIIDTYLEKPENQLGTALQLLSKAFKEGLIDRNQIRDEIKTLFFASFDTIAAAITWTLFFIDSEPGIREKLTTYIDNELKGRNPTFDEAPKLHYVQMIVKESIRLLPPAWEFHRTTLNDTVVGEYRIPKNTWIFISPYVVHRNPQYWHDPEAFIPERFENEADLLPPRYDYIPFGQGPHICLGKRLAMVETCYIIIRLIQEMKFEFLDHRRPKLKTYAVISAKKKAYCRLNARY